MKGGGSMDALQGNDVNEPQPLFGTRYIFLMVMLLLLGACLVGCFIGAIVSIVASVGPLSFVEAWSQFGVLIAIAMGLVSFIVGGWIVRLMVIESFIGNAAYIADQQSHE